MATVKLKMEQNLENEAARTFYKPTQADFERILERLRAQVDRITLNISPTILDEGNETKQEKHERLRQEALQRDQYILSMRPNRHIVFAAKFAKIKNRGLTRSFEKRVHIWSQEMERNFRLVSSNVKSLEMELRQTEGQEKMKNFPPLRKSDLEEKFERQCRPVKNKDVRLPKLERHKAKRHGAERSDHVKSNRNLKGRGSKDFDKIKLSNPTIRLPPIENSEKQEGFD